MPYLSQQQQQNKWKAIQKNGHKMHIKKSYKLYKHVPYFCDSEIKDKSSNYFWHSDSIKEAVIASKLNYSLFLPSPRSSCILWRG